MIRYRIRKKGKYQVLEKVVDGKIVGTKSLDPVKLWVRLGGSSNVETKKGKKVEKSTRGRKKKPSQNFAHDLLDEPTETEILRSLEESKYGF